MVSHTFLHYLMLASAGMLLRATISLHSYSGKSKSPMHGDFEAQRHWQEVTVNLPIKDWYENTTDNDLMYWGLDYPPLTAYHSYLIGCFAKVVNASYVELHTSRGITTDQHKNFMRHTVLVADLLIYIPAMVVACSIIFNGILNLKNRKTEGLKLIYLLAAVLYPGQIIIDNGHFQYNNISLGLTVFAVAAILTDRRILGSILFILSLNYKQMELYHAIPFFCYLLANCFFNPDNSRKYSISCGIKRLGSLGFVVVTSFAVIWLPWLSTKDGLLQVIHRIFPIARGVFEDKVSNIWCIVNIFMKIRSNFSNEEMAKICLTCTAAAIVPSAINLLIKPKKKQFLYALVNSSLAFFLFSFQVHEKSILIAAIPAILIFPMEPFMVFWFLQVSTFSMFPLLVKDGLLVAFIGLSGVFWLLTKIVIDATKDEKRKSQSFLTILWNINHKSDSKLLGNFLISSYIISTVAEIILIIGFLYIQPPARLPFLHPLLISAFGCCHFLMFFIYFNVKQIFYE